MSVRGVLVPGWPVDVDLLVEVAIRECVDGIQLAGFEVKLSREGHKKAK